VFSIRAKCSLYKFFRYIMTTPALSCFSVHAESFCVHAERGRGIGESEGTWNCGEGTVERFGWL
jgi:hypothetical protein